VLKLQAGSGRAEGFGERAARGARRRGALGRPDVARAAEQRNFTPGSRGELIARLFFDENEPLLTE
jgi:hypothetical protein